MSRFAFYVLNDKTGYSSIVEFDDGELLSWSELTDEFFDILKYQDKENPSNCFHLIEVNDETGYLNEVEIVINDEDPPTKLLDGFFKFLQDSGYKMTREEFDNYWDESL